MISLIQEFGILFSQECHTLFDNTQMSKWIIFIIIQIIMTIKHVGSTCRNTCSDLLYDIFDTGVWHLSSQCCNTNF